MPLPIQVSSLEGRVAELAALVEGQTQTVQVAQQTAAEVKVQVAGDLAEVRRQLDVTNGATQEQSQAVTELKGQLGEMKKKVEGVEKKTSQVSGRVSTAIWCATAVLSGMIG